MGIISSSTKQMEFNINLLNIVTGNTTTLHDSTPLVYQ